MSRHTGFAHLPLHSGRAPAWLFTRMARLAREIATHIVADQGPDELLRRRSDPFWFQAFGCVLGRVAKASRPRQHWPDGALRGPSLRSGIPVE